MLLMVLTPLSAEIFDSSVPNSIVPGSQLILQGKKLRSKNSPTKITLIAGNDEINLDYFIFRKRKNANSLIINIPIDIDTDQVTLKINTRNRINTYELAVNRMNSITTDQLNTINELERTLDDLDAELTSNRDLIKNVALNVSGLQFNINDNLTSNINSISSQLNSYINDNSLAVPERIFDLKAAVVSVDSEKPDTTNVTFNERIIEGAYKTKASGFIRVPATLTVTEGDAGSDWAELILGNTTVCYQGSIGGTPDYEFDSTIITGSGECAAGDGTPVVLTNDMAPINVQDDIIMRLFKSDRTIQITIVELTNLVIEKVNSSL